MKICGVLDNSHCDTVDSAEVESTDSESETEDFLPILLSVLIVVCLLIIAVTLVTYYVFRRKNRKTNVELNLLGPKVLNRVV